MYRFYFFLVLCLHVSPVFATSDVWLLVDTNALTLEVKKGRETIAVFENIAIGRSGSGVKEKRDDNVTPLGIFTISWINRASNYHLFYGFNYPSMDNAQTALHDGRIERSLYNSLIKAHQRQEVPPQDTTLGGQIGIHGLGRGDEKMHKKMNWTRGCIALTNEQIDRLDKWISKGTVVKVK